MDRVTMHLRTTNYHAVTLASYHDKVLRSKSEVRVGARVAYIKI